MLTESPDFAPITLSSRLAGLAGAVGLQYTNDELEAGEEC